MDTKEAERNVCITGVCITIKWHLHTDIKVIEPCVRITEVSVVHSDHLTVWTLKAG